MLQALGATPARVRRVMVFSGLLLGGTGIAVGIAIGCAASWIMTATRAVRFPPGLARVYMVDSIPFVPAAPSSRSGRWGVPVHRVACLYLACLEDIAPGSGCISTSNVNPLPKRHRNGAAVDMCTVVG